MSNKYLEKIAGLLPKFKQFGGVKGTIEAAFQTAEEKARFANKGIKELRIRKAKAEQSAARKELGKAVGVGAAVGVTAKAVSNKKKE